MAKANRKCVVCGQEYFYCTTNCAESRGKPSWMISFCSDNCKKVYEACAAFNAKMMSAEQAKKILDTCDLSNKGHFTLSTQRLIIEIYETAKVEEIVVLNVESEMVDHIVLSETINKESNKNNNSTYTKPNTYNYKKKKK